MRSSVPLVAILVALGLAGCASAPRPDSGVEGTVTAGPTCPVEREPPDPACADRPLATRLALTTADQSRVIKEFESDESGRFRVAAASGDYAIRSASYNTLPHCSTGPFTVVEHDYVRVDVSCDTGIR